MHLACSIHQVRVSTMIVSLFQKENFFPNFATKSENQLSKILNTSAHDETKTLVSDQKVDVRNIARKL